jgi:hypothetical protein
MFNHIIFDKSSKLIIFNLNLAEIHLNFYNNYSCTHQKFSQSNFIDWWGDVPFNLYINYLTFLQKVGAITLRTALTIPTFSSSTFTTHHPKVNSIQNHSRSSLGQALRPLFCLSNAGIMLGLELRWVNNMMIENYVINNPFILNAMPLIWGLDLRL